MKKFWKLKKKSCFFLQIASHFSQKKTRDRGKRMKKLKEMNKNGKNEKKRIKRTMQSRTSIEFESVAERTSGRHECDMNWARVRRCGQRTRASRNVIRKSNVRELVCVRKRSSVNTWETYKAVFRFESRVDSSNCMNSARGRVDQKLSFFCFSFFFLVFFFSFLNNRILLRIAFITLYYKSTPGYLEIMSECECVEMIVVSNRITTFFSPISLFILFFSFRFYTHESPSDKPIGMGYPRRQGTQRDVSILKRNSRDE